MKSAIIIPYRHRKTAMIRCIESIRAAAGDDVAVVMVGDSFDSWDLSDRRHKFLWHNIVNDSEPFNKAKSFNLGIDLSEGDVLTFLDCDMLVGSRFLEGAQRLIDDPGLTILCYRVRNAPSAAVDWTKYDSYPKVFEAYGDPEHGAADPNLRPIFGNSQFSIRREVLGDLRYDEGYVGRGFEDLDMMRQIWCHYGTDYRAEIMTDADHALIHVAHEYEPDWNDRRLKHANLLRYKATWHEC